MSKVHASPRLACSKINANNGKPTLRPYCDSVNSTIGENSSMRRGSSVQREVLIGALVGPPKLVVARGCTDCGANCWYVPSLVGGFELMSFALPGSRASITTFIYGIWPRTKVPVCI